jgi:hypothetical protein
LSFRRGLLSIWVHVEGLVIFVMVALAGCSTAGRPAPGA